MKLRPIRILLVVLPVPVIVAALSVGRRPDFEALRTKGRNLTREGAASCEVRLKANPDDFEIRYQLAWYYSLHSYGPDGSRLPQAREHALWIIRNRPDAYLAGQFMTLWDDLEGLAAIRQIWLENVQRHGENPAVLGNAADFLQLWTRDPGEAHALLLKAQRLDPTNPEWSFALGHLYGNKCHPPESEQLSPNARAKFAARSVAAFELALRYSDRSPRYDEVLYHVITNAMRAGDLDKAERYARQALDSSIEDVTASKSSFAVANSFGDAVIAHVALLQGDLNKAEQHFLRATAAALPPDSFFPASFNLIGEFLKRGRKATVIECLKRRPKFLNAATIDGWIAQIESGMTPELFSIPWY